jgi:UDP-N-acetyl-D-mannosaminuronic acid dehydrogenase
LTKIQEKVAIIGGAGHVGLPLGVALANRGVDVIIYDINEVAVAGINSGIFPFRENGGESELNRAINSGNFQATTSPSSLKDATVLITIIGTPVDDHLNPNPDSIRQSLMDLIPYMSSGQLLVLRSTVFPGVTRSVERLLREFELEINVVTAPERIAEGFAFTELLTIPQVLGCRNDDSFERASHLFGALSGKSLRCVPEEAELVKLFSNTWRYIKFAAANELYGLALQSDLDFEKIRELMVKDYPRCADFPRAGFAAGPCLPKDVLQLSSYSQSFFQLGLSAYSVNENLPNVVVRHVKKQLDITNKIVAILGMAFKADSDDPRSSLSYKLRKLLSFECKEVLCSDPYVIDSRLVSLDEALINADVIIIAVPHREYLSITSEKPIFKAWSLK